MSIDRAVLIEGWIIRVYPYKSLFKTGLVELRRETNGEPGILPGQQRPAGAFCDHPFEGIIFMNASEMNVPGQLSLSVV